MSKQVKLSIEEMQEQIKYWEEAIKRNPTCAGAQHGGAWREYIRIYKYHIGVLRSEQTAPIVYLEKQLFCNQ